MRKLIAIGLMLASSESFGQDFYFAFEEGDFLGGFIERTYIHGTRALKVRWDTVGRQNLSAAERIPAWKVIELSDSQLSEYVSQIVELGVADWKADYSVEVPEGFTSGCEGYGYSLRIEGRGLNVESSGNCATPDSLAAFQAITAELFSRAE